MIQSEVNQVRLESWLGGFLVPWAKVSTRVHLLVLNLA